MLAEILEDFLVHLVLPDSLLVEVGGPAVDRVGLLDEELLRTGPAGGALEERLRHRAGGGQERGHRQPGGSQGSSHGASIIISGRWRPPLKSGRTPARCRGRSPGPPGSGGRPVRAPPPATRRADAARR